MERPRRRGVVISCRDRLNGAAKLMAVAPGDRSARARRASGFARSHSLARPITLALSAPRRFGARARAPVGGGPRWGAPAVTRPAGRPGGEQGARPRSSFFTWSFSTTQHSGDRTQIRFGWSSRVREVRTQERWRSGFHL